MLGPIRGNTGLQSGTPTEGSISSWWNPFSYSLFGGGSTAAAPTSNAAASAVSQTIPPKSAKSSLNRATTGWKILPWNWGGKSAAPSSTPAPEATIEPGKTEKSNSATGPTATADMFHTVITKGYLWNGSERTLNPEYSRFQSHKVNLTDVEPIIKNYTPKMALSEYRSKLANTGLSDSEVATVFEETVDPSRMTADNREWLISNFGDTATALARKWTETDKKSLAALQMNNSCLTNENSRLRSQLSSMRSDNARLTEVSQTLKSSAANADTASPSSAAAGSTIPPSN